MEAEGFPHTFAPLAYDPPWVDKPAALAMLRAAGIEPPRLYIAGASHNNCSGFCVKAGMGHWAWLLRAFPGRYAYFEAQEEMVRSYLGKDVSILRDRKLSKDRKRVVVTPLTLRQFRERILGGVQCDLLDFGGCGCFAG